jgi:sulfatase maturation enzyme AslB (radical SAM superfamily)
MTDQLHRFQSLKILAHYDKLEAITRGEMPYPIDWHVYPSNVCNHSCTFCMFIQNGEQKNFHVKLPRDLLLRAVDDAFRTGAVLMHFSGGGEPLLNRWTPEALAAAQVRSTERVRAGGKPLRTAMSTNGALLTPAVAMSVNYLRISLNAGTPEQHHATNHGGDPRHPGDWHKIMENIATCMHVLKRHREHTKEPHDLGLAFVVEHENYRDIPAFCRVAASLGVDFVHIRPGFYYDGAMDAAVRGVMEQARLLCEAAKWELRDSPLKIFSISEKFEGYWTPRTYHACRAVLTGVCLRATGDFAVCQDRTDLTFGGGYRDGETFEDVWHSDEHRRVVASIHDGAGGELTKCPRCVWSNRNTLIDAIERDDLRIALV